MERRHHLATDHGPMVQGGLLTAHPGSDHGDGGAPGGDSSLRQGAGTVLLAIPRLESRRWQNSGENRVTEVFPRVFGAGEIYRPKGGLEGRPHLARRVPGAASPLAMPGGRLARGWPPSGPPLVFWSLLSR